MGLDTALVSAASASRIKTIPLEGSAIDWGLAGIESGATSAHGVAARREKLASEATQDDAKRPEVLASEAAEASERREESTAGRGPEAAGPPQGLAATLGGSRGPPCQEGGRQNGGAERSGETRSGCPPGCVRSAVGRPQKLADRCEIRCDRAFPRVQWIACAGEAFAVCAARRLRLTVDGSPRASVGRSLTRRRAVRALRGDSSRARPQPRRRSAPGSTQTASRGGPP